MRLSKSDFLPELRQAAFDRVDAAAGRARLAYITSTAGQDMVYEQKYNEALAYLADPEIDDAQIPHIVSEIGITGETKYHVSQVICGMRDYWVSVSAAIEAKRLAIKNAIGAAGTPEDILEAEDVTWP
jgi:hypothetical protein